MGKYQKFNLSVACIFSHLFFLNICRIVFKVHFRIPSYLFIYFKAVNFSSWVTILNYWMRHKKLLRNLHFFPPSGLTSSLICAIRKTFQRHFPWNIFKYPSNDYDNKTLESRISNYAAWNSNRQTHKKSFYKLVKREKKTYIKSHTYIFHYCISVAMIQLNMSFSRSKL